MFPNICLRRTIRLQRGRRRFQPTKDLRNRNDRLRLSLHRQLRHNLGTTRMGRELRALPLPVPRRSDGAGHVRKLVLELHARLLHALHHRRHPVRVRLRLCRLQPRCCCGGVFLPHGELKEDS